MLEGETDFKKMYRDHVQEHIDLKKHVNNLEAAKMKKLQEISQTQNSFLRKYNKYVDGSLHPSKRRTSGLHSPAPLPGITTLGGRRKSVSDISVTKNSGASMPVDSPYSLESWHTLVNNGCRDSTAEDPLKLHRDQLVRAPDPHVLSLEEENKPIPHTPNNSSEVSVTVKRRLSRDLTSLDNSSSDQSQTYKKQLRRRSSLDISDNSLLLRRERTEVPKSCLNTSPPSKRKPQDRHVTIGVDADNTVEHLTLETTQVKLPSIDPDHSLKQRRNTNCDGGASVDMPPSTPATWSGMTPRVRRGRSNSLAPGMLQSFQATKGFNATSPIKEQDETGIMKKVRSNSSGEIEEIRKKLSSAIKETTSVEKAALQIMVENSKGIHKFKYLAKMVNVGLKEMKTNEKENNKSKQTVLDQDIFSCRYLRMPRGSISGPTGGTDVQ